MKTNKRQRILIGLCSLAAAALIGDRLLNSSGGLSPNESVAAEPAAGGAMTANPAPAAPVPEVKLTNGPSSTLAARLDELAKIQSQDSAARDAFRTPPGWLAETHGKTPLVESTPMEARAEQFLQRHKLVAIMAGPDGHVAMIDNASLKVGGKLDGFEVAAIDQHSVTLVRDATRVTLRISPDAPNPSD